MKTSFYSYPATLVSSTDSIIENILLNRAEHIIDLLCLFHYYLFFLPSAHHYVVAQNRVDELDDYLSKSRDKDESKTLPALDHLLVFANVGRILFNRQTHVQAFCERVLTYQNGKRTPVHLPKRPTVDHALTVSLHLRRADSCDHKSNGHSTSPSPLYSHAQPSNRRKCYDTEVYLDGLRRIQNATDQPIEVFLSTDDAGSVIQDIQKRDADLYKSFVWHVLDISREDVKYDGMIDSPERKPFGALGKHAIADLWLLSHGQVFIGHLGSRFGKVGWLLATARYQRFVPFLSVDGHSFCCEIDENCGEVKPYIRSMENCMTFAHEQYHEYEMHDGYWEFGSLKRIMAVVEKEYADQ